MELEFTFLLRACNENSEYRIDAAKPDIEQQPREEKLVTQVLMKIGPLVKCSDKEVNPKSRRQFLDHLFRKAYIGGER